MTLNARQTRFVQEYLIDLNATQAAIRAGYSEKTAYSVGHENLSKPEISKAIAEAQQERAERTGITQDRVLAELGKIAFQDVRKAVRWGGSPNGDSDSYPVELVPSEDIDDDTAAAVSEVSLTQSGVKIKMHDKQAALVNLGKHLGMFTDKVEHTGKDGGPIEVEDVSDKEIARRVAFLLMKGAQEG